MIHRPTRLGAAASLLILALLLAPGAMAVERVVLAPTADATLIEHPDGALADGAGRQFRAGRTGQPMGSIRRALVRFDLASSVPRHATITDVAIVIQAGSSGSGPTTISLHRVLRRWSEGPSAFAGGQGAPSEAGDATWLHRSYDRALWDSPGGDFLVEPSASTVVDGAGSYSWSANGLIDDVRRWLTHPRRNHGWILIGDEDGSGTAKKLEARETPFPGLPPLLLIEFERPGHDDDSSSSGDDDSSSDDDSDDSGPRGRTAPTRAGAQPGLGSGAVAAQ